MSLEHLLHDARWHGFSLSAAQASGWSQAFLSSVHRGLCGIRGHDLILHAESGRLSLRCLDCSWESPGWLLSGPKVSSDRGRPVRRPDSFLRDRKSTGAVPAWR